MKKISFILFLSIILNGCSVRLPSDNSKSQILTSDDIKYDLQVLFVGNSYTYYNDLPGMFVSLAESGGKSVYHDSSTSGGYSLIKHANRRDKIGKQTVDKISDSHQNWDYVVLQEQSLSPIDTFKKFEKGAQELTNIIVGVNAKPAFYMTWGRKDGLEELSFKDMNSELESAYSKVADQNKGLLIPIGSVWGKVIEENENFGLKLWDKDGSHPSYIGSYLNACIFYATFFNESPVGLWHDQEEISNEDAEIVQKIVADFFEFEWYKVIKS